MDTDREPVRERSRSPGKKRLLALPFVRSDSEYMLSAMPVYSQIPLLTVDDYRALSETGPRYQLIEGDLYRAPAPNRFHQDISRNLQFELHSYLKTNPTRGAHSIKEKRLRGRVTMICAQ